jgi:hypothetical protein
MAPAIAVSTFVACPGFSVPDGSSRANRKIIFFIHFSAEFLIIYNYTKYSTIGYLRRLICSYPIWRKPFRAALLAQRLLSYSGKREERIHDEIA